MKIIAVWIGLFTASVAYGDEPKFPAEQVEFFEAKVRPLLIESCYPCHSDKKQSGSLRLDSRKTILEGGDTGPAAVPGNPDKSLLIKAIRYEGDLKMPEKQKLDPAKIEILVSWVKQGMPFPDKGAVITKADAMEAAKKHWAFQPLSHPKGESIDEFIDMKLKSQNLKRNPAADKRVLIRRLYFDLLGLPPRPDEIEAFAQDHDPKAYEKLIEKLLANPHYGERWGRYWLDYARYSDTKGYLAGGVDRNYPYAYTYRDWVVKAMNEDMPYDRFVKLQLAADRVAKPEESSDLAAMGFLTVGRRFLGDGNDIIDDRIDVVFRTFQGLTVTCARCHDHKFDPIPTKDYYAMHGVFNSSVEPVDLPLLTSPKETSEYKAFSEELSKRESAVTDYQKKRRSEFVAGLKSSPLITKYLLLERKERNTPGDKLRPIFQDRELFQFVFTRYKQVVADKKNASIFSLWIELAALSPENFELKSRELLSTAAKSESKLVTDPIVLKAFEVKKPKTLAEAAQILAKLLAESIELKNKFPEQGPLANLVTETGGLANFQDAEIDQMFNTADRNKINALKAKVEEWKVKSPAAPPRAMVMVDAVKPHDSRIFVRGNPGNQGAIAPRQFLEVLSHDPKPFKIGSGRQEMAEAIANKDNPLTARVMVNRVWQLHFGQGIVRTPSDFGLRSDPPTHPELLDWLANKFMEDGWSIKKLHKRILMSETYRQTSDISAQIAKLDAENRLLSHQNRRRLDFESLRDSLLFTSGKLDEKFGGKPVELFDEPYPNRRSIYGQVDRQNLPGTFRIFDFASPDSHSPQRFQTTVPQQGLFLLNSPFLAEQARALVDRSEVARETDAKRKIEEMVYLVLGRKATQMEVERSLQFIKLKLNDKPYTVDDAALSWSYGYGEVNEKKGFVAKFTPYSHWTGTAWQGGAKLPDPKTGWTMLNAQGGHPGDNPHFAAIRRWTSPAKMDISITSTLRHPNKDGDGVRGAIISNKRGVLHEEIVHNSSKELSLKKYAVEKGETIDFVADCHKDTNSDSFSWAPLIKQIGGEGRSWDATRDFRGPKVPVKEVKFGEWEELAQILLLSNEFAFVD